MFKIFCFVIALILIAGYFFKSCFSNNDKNVLAVEVSAKNIIYNNGIPVEFSSVFRIYYFNSLIMYQYFYHYDSTINGKSILDEDRRAFFIYHNDSLYGYHFDSNPHKTMPDDMRLSVDSILQKLNNFNYDSFLTQR